jgi:hypothetical protein
MKALSLLAVLAVAGCSANGSQPNECVPACDSSHLCCAEPTHGAAPDGGGADAGNGGGTAWVCTAPTNSGDCPLLP